MENSAPSNIWTYNMHWYHYLTSLIQTIILKFMSPLYAIFFFIILFVTIWCKDNKLITYLSKSPTGEQPIGYRQDEKPTDQVD